MRALATRSRWLAVGIAALSAAALAAVSASAAQASGTSTTTSQPHRATALAVAYKPTGSTPDDVNAANQKFAACMRGQGQKYYPDVHATKDGSGHAGLRVRMAGGKGFDPTSDAYQNALDACAPILKKVGITFPDAAGLPPLPGKPGKPGTKGPFVHTEKGLPKGGLHTEESDSAMPGLVESA
jgi:hypothetical protein